METINAVIFYILCAICLISGIFCMFQKETVNAVISAVVFFWGVSGFYFLLKAPYLGCVQILVWGVGVSILMLFSVMMTNKKDDERQALPEKSGAIDLKTIAAPVIGVIFAILIIPFILYQFGCIKTVAEHPIQDFAIVLYKNNTFSFELTGILLFAAIAGICTIIILKAVKNGSGDIKFPIANKGNKGV